MRLLLGLFFLLLAQLPARAGPDDLAVIIANKRYDFAHAVEYADRDGEAMRDLAESMSSSRWLQTFIYGVLFVFITSVMTFPLAMYTDFTREHAFGLSNLSMEDWLKESAIGLAVGCIMTSIFLVGLYAT